MKVKEILESASGGSTSAGSIASVASPLGSISRRPSIFGYVGSDKKPKKKKKKKSNTSEMLENGK